MNTDNRARQIAPTHLPTPKSLYSQNGGRISDEREFGRDPLDGDPVKSQMREEAFTERYPDMDTIFHQLVNYNSSPFQQALKSITYRLSSTRVYIYNSLRQENRMS